MSYVDNTKRIVADIETNGTGKRAANGLLLPHKCGIIGQEDLWKINMMAKFMLRAEAGWPKKHVNIADA